MSTITTTAATARILAMIPILTIGFIPEGSGIQEACASESSKIDSNHFEHLRHHIVNLNRRQLPPTTFDLDLTLCQRAFTDSDPDGNPDQIRILEFDAWTLVTIIQQHLNAARGEFLIDSFRV